jgi:GNAT superfamily N-acetyltransferase
VELDVREAFLSDGRRVVFRPILPEDKLMLQEGLTQLSDETRYLRFFSPIDHFTESQLRYLTEIDYEDHYAWVAVLPDEVGSPGVGVARWIRLKDRPDVAEGAVVVVDSMQNNGVGKTLLWLAARSAIERGIKAFQVWTLGDNRTVHHLLEGLGASPVASESGTQEFLVPLPEDADALTGTPAPLVLRAVAQGKATVAHVDAPQIRLD